MVRRRLGKTEAGGMHVHDNADVAQGGEAQGKQAFTPADSHHTTSHLEWAYVTPHLQNMEMVLPHFLRLEGYDRLNRFLVFGTCTRWWRSLSLSSVPVKSTYR